MQEIKTRKGVVIAIVLKGGMVIGKIADTCIRESTQRHGKTLCLCVLCVDWTFDGSFVIYKRSFNFVSEQIQRKLLFLGLEFGQVPFSLGGDDYHFVEARADDGFYRVTDVDNVAQFV